MYVVQCHPAIKETEVLPFATNVHEFGTYIDLGRVIQTQRDKYNVVVWNLKNKLVNIKQQKQIHGYREQTGSLKWD